MKLRLGVLGATLALVLLVAGCSKEAAPRPTAPVTTPTPSAASMKATAENRYMVAMSKPLAEKIRAQTWYQAMTPAHVDMIGFIQQSEKAASVRGDTASVADVFAFATEQGWYQDGLDEREAIALGGIFEAYKESLADDYAPLIGTMIATTMRNELFEVVPLSEGPVVVLVSGEDVKLGRKALDLAKTAMPEVEAVIGRFPYRFLYIEVTKDLPEYILGLSYDEFISIAKDSVDEATLVHEITHSTLYGIFPIWFEEGFAHFLENYLTEGIPAAASDYQGFLRSIGRDTRLDLRPGRTSAADYFADRAQGFLFLKGVYDIVGIDELSRTIKTLRTQSATGQDLIRALIQQASPENQPKLQQLVCQQVVGTTRNYCTP